MSRFLQLAAVVSVYLLVLWGARALDAAHENQAPDPQPEKEEIYYAVPTPEVTE